VTAVTFEDGPARRRYHSAAGRQFARERLEQGFKPTKGAPFGASFLFVVNDGHATLTAAATRADS